MSEQVTAPQMRDAPELTEQEIEKHFNALSEDRARGGTTDYFSTAFVLSLLSMARRTADAEEKLRAAEAENARLVSVCESRKMYADVCKQEVQAHSRVANAAGSRLDAMQKRAEAAEAELAETKRHIETGGYWPPSQCSVYTECQCPEYNSIPGSARFNPACPVHGEKL